MDYERVRAIVRDLLKEFRADLERLGARVDELEARIKELEERPKVEGLPVSIDFKWVQDIDSTRGSGVDELDWPSDRAGYIRVDIASERQIDENWKAALKLIWVSGAAGRETNGLEVNELYLQGKVNLPLVGESAVTAGRQRVKFGYGYLLDTDFAAIDGVRVDANRFGLNWTFVGAEIPTGNTFTDYHLGANDGLFGIRVSRGLLGGERLTLGLNWLYTGELDYKAYGADLRLKLLGGSILPEVRAEWVRSYRDINNNKARGNLYSVWADILKSDRLDIVASYTDTTSNFAGHAVTIYNPFYITTAELLFLRPVAFGATAGGLTLADKVFDVRADLKVFGKTPVSLRWFTGDDATGADFGDVFTVAYRGWKIGRLALDVVYGNKTKGDSATKQQYVGLAASTSF